MKIYRTRTQEEIFEIHKKLMGVYEMYSRISAREGAI